jgi:hypothetical protein
MLVVGAGVLAKFSAAAAAYAEVSELEDERAVVSDLVRNDFDGAGRNLTRAEPPETGKVEPAFLQNSDFDTGTPGRLLRTATSGWTGTALTRAFSAGAAGLAKFDFTPPPTMSSVSIYGTGGGGNFTLVIGNGNPAVGVWTAVYENGVLAAQSCCSGPVIPPHLGGDSYGIHVERGDAGPVVKLYRTRGGSTDAIWTSQAAAPPYPLTASASVYGQNTAITDFTMEGGPIIKLFDPGMQSAQLPIDRGQRLTGPVTITGGNSATILSGDPDTDVVYSGSPFAGTSSSDLLPASPPRRGSFNTGDYAMVIDFLSNRAALYRVRLLDAASGLMNLTLVTDSAPAWGRLWSDQSDPLPSFPAGSVVVKLAPPVTYAVSADGRLVRLEGDRPATAAFGVRAFSVTEISGSASKAYAVAATLASEGFQTDQTAAGEPRSTVEYTSTPPALNLFSNQLNSTR